MVTIEGESLSPGGSMTGGAFKNNSNLLGRRREIEELERSVGIYRKELEETQKSIGENRSRRNVASRYDRRFSAETPSTVC